MSVPASTTVGDEQQAGPAGASPRAILWAVGFSVFVAADDLTVVSTMLRPIIGDLGLVLPDGLDDAAWIVNAYLIAFIAIMPIAGRVSDVIGRRRTFMLAYLTFLVGTIWIPLSDSLGTLLVGRVLTAVGGGAMVPVALAVVGDAYPVAKRARALGTLGAIETMGWVWGPLYGAMLVRFLSWRWQFWLNIPLAVAGAAAVWWALADHDTSTRRARTVDWLGAALLTVAIVALNLALLGGAEVQSVQGLDELTGNNANDLRLLYPVALISGVAFVWQQRRRRRLGREPLIDGKLFAGRNVRVALIVNFLVGAGLVIAMVDVPLFVNAVEVDLERSAVISGWILSALTAAMAVASYLGGRITERTWYGPPIVLGLVLATGAYAVMGASWGADTPYLFLGVQLALLGAGIGLTVAPTTSAVVDHAEPDARGAAAAVVMVVRMIGLSVGLSALTAWGLARFNALRGDLDLPPLTDPDFPAALADATEQLTAQSIADTFMASAIVLGIGLALCLALLRRSALAAPDDPSSPGSPGDTTDPLPASSIPMAAALAHAGRSPEETDMSTDDPIDQPTGETLDQPTIETLGAGSHTDGADEQLASPTPDEADAIDGTLPPPQASTDELPVLALAGTDAPLDPDDLDPLDHRRSPSESWLHRHLVGVMAGVGLALLVMIALLGVMVAQVSAARADLDDMRAELETTREDMERVEAGAAIFASQVNGFVEQIGELGPTIGDGLDQAITGLEEFATSELAFTVNIDETISISQSFDLNRTVEVPINTTLPINESFDTRVVVDGPFGVDIPINLTVPVDLEVPIDLTVDIPIDESIPIDVDVPVQLDVPIVVDVEGTELAGLATSLIDGLRAFQEGLGGLTGN